MSRCIRESLEGCPLDTLLRFTYKPRGSAADLFGERVQRVRLCVYRPDGSIEHMQTLEKSELDRLQGVEMYLPQGNYTVVLWANASDAQTKARRLFRRRNHKEPFRLTPACGDFRFHPHA
ncbi:FimB/Mfa2 family fimbrial subunit [Bacteroides thetaiotaomicron]|uniref:FimB/Mfa2 family fimbrial subunit n=1 Tax=Bacteroides thetaiotaomicron TaxID=818 RepID=UPI002165B3D0|nr:FimB/Mfa2 family fimbrial subunit [Bacteroides thetaiotaomicron]MCS2909792.1 FimB/Mfa2 family fimbrial subunit [Bacteroides thetaiotaomicron]